MKPLLLLTAGWFLVTDALPAQQPLDEFLKRGQLDEALAAYAQPRNDTERFSLAVAQVLDGARDFSVGFNRLSLHPNLRNTGLPFFRAVVMDAPAGKPRVATPAAVAALFRELRAAMQNANITLGRIEGAEEFSVPITLNEARADFSGDGTISAETETLQAAFGRILGVQRAPLPGVPLIVHFDRADAAWLKGYTHLLTGIIDLLASYDWTPVWGQCAHGLFLKPEPMPEIAKLQGPRPPFDAWPDFIAAIHDMRLEVNDAEGLKRCRESFLAMIAQSRICWRRVQQENDDVHEWLPNPAQTGPGGVKVTLQQIDGWFRVLDELEAIARGRKLIPHWRMKPSVGINLDRLMAVPPKLDLILWLQGSAFLPYVEEGAVSGAQTWQGLTGPFGPGFFRFAIWSN